MASAAPVRRKTSEYYEWRNDDVGETAGATLAAAPANRGPSRATTWHGVGHIASSSHAQRSGRACASSDVIGGSTAGEMLKISVIVITRKRGNYSDVLPLKAARRDSISNLTSFGASNLSCRRTQCRVCMAALRQSIVLGLLKFTVFMCLTL